ncbi:hypothetical protein ACFLR4_04870 [Bacteroidota bacterium]
MKFYLSLLFIILIVSSVQAQKSNTSIVAMGNFGYTVVDVPDAMGWPEYTSANGHGLSDWDNVNMNFFGQVIFKSSKKFSWGVEGGANRLYYWEERDDQPSGTPYFYWGEIWTYHIGPVFRWEIGKQIYFYTGADVHIFSNDSGATGGAKAAIGYEIPLSKSVSIPLEARVDVIFGDATPIGIGGGAGLKFDLK